MNKRERRNVKVVSGDDDMHDVHPRHHRGTICDSRLVDLRNKVERDRGIFSTDKKLPPFRTCHLVMLAINILRVHSTFK